MIQDKIPRKSANEASFRGLRILGKVLFYQTVLIAVYIEAASPLGTDPCFGVSFGIEFYKLHPVRGEISQEGDIMLLCHFVGKCNKTHVIASQCAHWRGNPYKACHCEGVYARGNPFPLGMYRIPEVLILRRFAALNDKSFFT